MVQARMDLDDYTIRVLDVVKGKFALKNKNDALNKFFELFGDHFIEPEFDEKETMVLMEEAAKYKTSKNKKRMTMEELDDILGL